MSTVKFLGAGILTAIAASLCCITPVLALIVGSGSVASSFSWIAPARPYMIGITILVLGFAWYQKLKPQKKDDCGCAVDEKPKFIQSKTFLLIVTIFAALMMTFPSYAKVFFPNDQKAVVVTEKLSTQTVEFTIEGMSCDACELEVNHEIKKLPGIIHSAVSYPNKNALVKFDVSKTTIKDISVAINSTGYKIINQVIKN